MSDLAIAENTNISLLAEDNFALLWTHIGNSKNREFCKPSIALPRPHAARQQAPSLSIELRNEANKLLVFNDCSAPGP